VNLSVFLALVHNNNQVRNNYLFPKISELLNGIANNFQVSKSECSFQSAIEPHGFMMALLRELCYQYLGFKWKKYRQLRASLLREIIPLINILVKYLLNQNKLISWRRTSAIEMNLTDKHIRAWGKFVDTDASYLIVFEDDVMFKDDSIEKLNNLLKTLSGNNLNKACYVDLAGGYQIADLLVDSLEESRNRLYRRFRKPITNTTCAYLINRQLAAIFLEILTQKPWLRLIGADWLINTLFIEMERRGINADCLHFEPTIFKHGTTSGDYPSSIR
jgi:hypothetical protein